VNLKTDCGCNLKDNRSKQWRSLLIAVLLATFMHCFYSFVFLRAEQIEDARLNRPRGNFSDLYPAWLGTRELLVNHRDPYGPEVTANIQKGVWGRIVDARNPGDPKDQSRFAYPLYVVFILAPTVLFSFSVVKQLYIIGAIITGILSIWCWVRLFHPGRSRFQFAVCTALCLGSWPFVLALRIHQPALLVFTLISAAIGATSMGKLRLAGVLLAVSAIKPQSVIGIVGWLLLWSLSRWRDRKGLFLSFTLTFTLMLLAAEIILPGWIWKWREALSAYMQYAPLPGAYVELMFGNHLGKLVGLLVTLGILWFCWKSRRDESHTDRFKLAPALIFSANLFITPVWHAYDHIFLLPSAILLWEWRERFVCLNPIQRGILRFSVLSVLWQWLAASIAVAIVMVTPKLALNLRVLPYISILLFPAVILASLMLIGRSRLSGTLPSVRQAEIPQSYTSHANTVTTSTLVLLGKGLWNRHI
jgi:glycosyl transferase family 87